MARTVLVSDADSPVGRELVQCFEARGCQVVAATRAGAEPQRAAGGRATLSLRWNPSSPSSARAAVVSALNRFGSLDEGIVLGLPAAEPASAREIASAAVSEGLDRSLKGPMLLTRELLVHFARAGAGVLALALYSPRREEEAAQPLERALREGFRGFASSVLETAGGKTVLVNGFLCFGAGPAEFASFVERTLEEKGRKLSGRWFSLPGRAGIHGRH
jgi:NAD(P)-dependent dehydrogenase (short-subunit alcohol dehydrogenase family)